MAAGTSEHGSQNMEYVRTPPNENQPGPHGGLARDFATADGQRVMVTALTWRQFADLAHVTRLASTFAFLERLLHADFSTRRDLHAYRYTIAARLAPWFARRTVTDLTAAFAGTSVPWVHLHHLRPGPDHLGNFISSDVDRLPERAGDTPDRSDNISIITNGPWCYGPHAVTRARPRLRCV